MAKSRKPAKDKVEKVEAAVVIEDTSSVNDAEKVKPASKESPKKTPSVKAETADDLADDDKGSKAASASDGEKSVSQSPETEAESATPMAAEKTKSGGSGFFALLLGGAIAAAAGFGAARYPDQWPFPQNGIDPIVEELGTLKAHVAGLEAAGAERSTAIEALASDRAVDQLRGETTGALEQLRVQFDTLSGKISELENRIHTVEKLPQGSGMEAAAAAAAAYERELQQMRQMLDTELAQITSQKENAETLEVSAATAAKSAAARAALSRLQAALETGQPFSDALFDLTENAAIEAPAALSSAAADGVATQTNLQTSFPESARPALEASIRAAVEDGSMDRVSAFFRTQLGTRSLEPKEGDDADAVLSRAEAALKAGQIDVALNELEAMPEAGKPALEAWITRAMERRDALHAARDIAQKLNLN